MNVNNNEKIDIYFLIYKLYLCHKMWIVKVFNNVNDLEYYKKFINNVCSNSEKYYLIKRKIDKLQLHSYILCKNFTKFNLSRNDSILYQSYR